MSDGWRSDPGTLGLTTGIGWYVTKNSLGVYSTTPPPNGFRHASPQEEVDAAPSRVAAYDYAGPVTVEAWTVMHEREGEPALGIVATLTPDGARTWANTRKPDLLEALKGDALDRAAATLLP